MLWKSKYKKIEEVSCTRNMKAQCGIPQKTCFVEKFEKNLWEFNNLKNIYKRNDTTVIHGSYSSVEQLKR